MNSAYLLLGGNIGKIHHSFSTAKQLIEDHVGTIKNASSVYCSEPWGFESKNMFYNQVILVETDLSPKELLSTILMIETKMGRKRKKDKIENRIIDIDIIFYNDVIIHEKDLEIPHPRMHLRKFTLVPMTDIAPGMKHPVFNKTVDQLLEECEDKLSVFPCNNNNFLNS